VAVLPGEDDASPRYRLLESPKAFALERLAAAGEIEATQLRLAHAVSGLFAEAWDAFFCGTLTTGGLQRSLAADCDNARAALAWVQCPASVRLQISAVLQRGLPSTQIGERLALADACEALLQAEPSLNLRMVGWLNTAWTWVYARRQRSLPVAERAVAFARDHERLTSDRRYLYVALGVSAFAMTFGNELDAASTAVAEMRGLEDDATVPRHLMWREDVEFAIAGLRGDYVERLRVGRVRVARAPDAHDETVAMTNLIDAELAAGDVRAAATTGRTLVARLVSGRNEFHLALARLNLSAALLALDAVAETRPVAEAGWCQSKRFELQSAWADYLALLTALEQRAAAAARLCGYSVAAYDRLRGRRDVNEAAAFDRARRLAVSTLGDSEFERLQAEGRSLRDEDIAAIAFGTRDA